MNAFLDKLLVLPEIDVVQGLLAYMKTEEGRRTLPELAALAPDEVVTERNLHKNNFTHSIWVCAQAPARLRVRWAALYHDVGKAHTRRVEGSHVSFHGHEELGGRLTRKRLKALGYDPAFTEEVALLVEFSGRIASFSGEQGVASGMKRGNTDPWTDAAVRRIAREVGPLLEDALDLVAADCTSKHEARRKAARARVEAFRQRHRQIVAEDALKARRPPLDGQTVMTLLGVGPSRVVGEALKYLLDNHEGASEAEATEALMTWWKARD